MGRHTAPSAEPAGDDPRARRGEDRPHVDDAHLRALGPVTDPLLLDAVQQELRRSRPPVRPAVPPRPATGPVERATASAPPAAAPPTAALPAARADAAPATAPEPPAVDAPRAPAPPVSARQRSGPATDALPVLPAALHRGRTGAEAARARVATDTGAPALDLTTGSAGPRTAVRPSMRAIVVGLLVGIAVVVALSAYAVLR